MKVQLSGKRAVYNFCRPYIVAELGSNHNGDMRIARELIIQAERAGADAVKFQSWSKETIFSRKVYRENRFLKDDYRTRNDFTLEQIVDKFSISPAQLLEMKKIAQGVGIDCISTPFSPGEVDFLVDKMRVPFIKVASMDLNNYPFLAYIARKGLPIVLSTGLSTLSEIDRAIQTIEGCGNKKIVVLHCVSLYPPRDAQVNLHNIDTLRSLYPYPIGFSDHTIGTTIPLAAVAKGACLIEKHFTLDKKMFGWDHAVSADYDEMRFICAEAKRITAALGTSRITVSEDRERINAFRRSVVAKVAIKKGQRIRAGMLTFKRPGTGLEPESIRFIIGKTARKNIAQDALLTLTDF